MIVLDASAIVRGLLAEGEARRVLSVEDIVVPHLADSEVAHALRGLGRRGLVEQDRALAALERWGALGVHRLVITALLRRVWELRENVSAYDASYVVLAEALGCELLTADARLAAAVGPRCPIRLVAD